MSHIGYFLLLLAGLLLVDCEPFEEREELLLKGEVFGTYFQIKYYKNARQPLILKPKIDSIFQKINKSMSTYIPDSDISKVNSGDFTLRIDTLLREVFLLSKEIHKKSHGYFDPTIGILRNAYGFGDSEAMAQITKGQIDSMRSFVGFDKVNISPSGSIQKLDPRISLDFNAIAKGYAVDKVAEYMASSGIKNFLIEIGGEIRASGTKLPANEEWQIGIEQVNTLSRDRHYKDLVKIKNVSIAGSGNYRNYRIDPVSKQKYVHTINPINGKAEQNSMLATYVMANTCAEADAYATAFMAMGLEKSIQILQDLEAIEVYFVFSDSMGHVKKYISEGFEVAL